MFSKSPPTPTFSSSQDLHQVGVDPGVVLARIMLYFICMCFFSLGCQDEEGVLSPEQQGVTSGQGSLAWDSNPTQLSSSWALDLLSLLKYEEGLCRFLRLSPVRSGRLTVYPTFLECLLLPLTLMPFPYGTSFLPDNTTRSALPSQGHCPHPSAPGERAHASFSPPLFPPSLT